MCVCARVYISLTRLRRVSIAEWGELLLLLQWKIAQYFALRNFDVAPNQGQLHVYVQPPCPCSAPSEHAADEIWFFLFICWECALAPPPPPPNSWSVVGKSVGIYQEFITFLHCWLWWCRLFSMCIFRARWSCWAVVSSFALHARVYMCVWFNCNKDANCVCVYVEVVDTRVVERAH